MDCLKEIYMARDLKIVISRGPLTPRHLLAIISHRHGHFSFLFCFLNHSTFKDGDSDVLPLFLIAS
jgi:hypothetical protein